MITSEYFRDVLKRLLAKSRQNKVHWRFSQHDEEYFVNFEKNVSICIGFISPMSQPDRAHARLDVNCDTAVALNDEDGQEDFDLLRDLYFDAKRSYLGWDYAMSAIETALDSDSVIGTEPQTSQASAIPDDEIPF